MRSRKPVARSRSRAWIPASKNGIIICGQPIFSTRRNIRPSFSKRNGAGDIQWMTAGQGIIHQEMPKGDPVGQMHGFQLWANLPASLKMTPPRYQEVKAVEF